MAEFRVEAHGVRENDDWHGDTEGWLYANKKGSTVLSVDDLLNILYPAALKLRDYYKQAILSRFRRRTGSLADSIDVEENVYISSGEVSIRVCPSGRHKGGSLTRKSRAGNSARKYAKHNRKVSRRTISNQELAYLLEVGTPRIKPTHWMEETNDRVMDEIQDMVEEKFTEFLKEKGLIE